MNELLWGLCALTESEASLDHSFYDRMFEVLSGR